MSEKFRIDRKIGLQNTFYTKCINVIIESIGPSIILRSIYSLYITYIRYIHNMELFMTIQTGISWLHPSTFLNKSNINLTCFSI